MRLAWMSLVLTALALPAASVGAAAELPVSRVVLYKNGLALLERSGEAKPGEPVRLEFKKSEMDDVLKTLVLETSAGAVARLRYQLDAPLDQRLAEIGFSVDAGTSLAELLDQLRGAHIALVTAGAPVEGLIVSGRVIKIDAATDNRPAKKTGREELTILTAAGELRTIDLGQRRQRQVDGRTPAEAAHRSPRRLPAGAVDRTQIARGSKPPARPALCWPAIWSPRRCGSRLTASRSTQGGGHLEGWAIVENKSEGDWNNVQ